MSVKQYTNDSDTLKHTELQLLEVDSFHFRWQELLHLGPLLEKQHKRGGQPDLPRPLHHTHAPLRTNFLKL